MKFFKEFKEFAVKGNVIDLSIAVVLGTAFSKLTKSFVGDMLMPLISYLTGNVDVKKLTYKVNIPKIGFDGHVGKAAVEFLYGSFLQTVIDFFLIALFLFVLVKFLNSMKRKAEDPTNPAVPTPKDILLLSEIRDLLKNRETREGK